MNLDPSAASGQAELFVLRDDEGSRIDDSDTGHLVLLAAVLALLEALVPAAYQCAVGKVIAGVELRKQWGCDIWSTLK
jgi:hypothetical protein